ncbi:MAG: sigma 54-interacting transcriptional regulator [Pseudomonadota bacterium]
MSASGGYRYILESVDDTEHLRFYLEPGLHRVGRGDAGITIPLDGVSRAHCELDVLVDGGVVVRDLESTNGTRVNGARIAVCAVNEAIQISFGDHDFRLLPGSAEGLRLLLTGDVRPFQDSMRHTVAPTVRPDRDAELWAAAFEAVLRSATDFPALEWLAQLQKVTTAAALELRNQADQSVVAAVGRSEQATHELAVFGEWALWGDLDEPPTSTFGRMLALIPPIQSKDEQHTSMESAIETGTVQPELRRQLLDARRVAQSGISILICGDSGTGKEWTARWLHDQSPRADQAFYALNCAAIPDELLEAELFGIEAGVATGVEAREGVFSRASSGTLFLDEIGEMAAPLQAKLLRALDSGEVLPVGGRSPITVDVRVLSATNRDLEQAMREGSFRSDLYYRLAAHVLALPPLRRRREDIPALVSSFFRSACQHADRISPGVTTRALLGLVNYDWPGNVRQLRFTIERAVQLLDSGQPLDLPQLPQELMASEEAESTFRLRERVASAEAEALRLALQATDGEITAACRLLGIGRSTFYDKAKTLGVALPGADGDS